MKMLCYHMDTYIEPERVYIKSCLTDSPHDPAEVFLYIRAYLCEIHRSDGFPVLNTVNTSCMRHIRQPSRKHKFALSALPSLLTVIILKGEHWFQHHRFFLYLTFKWFYDLFIYLFIYLCQPWNSNVMTF